MFLPSKAGWTQEEQVGWWRTKRAPPWWRDVPRQLDPELRPAGGTYRARPTIGGITRLVLRVPLPSFRNIRRKRVALPYSVNAQMGSKKRHGPGHGRGHSQEAVHGLALDVSPRSYLENALAPPPNRSAASACESDSRSHRTNLFTGQIAAGAALGITDADLVASNLLGQDRVRTGPVHSTRSRSLTMSV